MNQAITDLFLEASKTQEYPIFGFNGIIILIAFFFKFLSTILSKIAGAYNWSSPWLTEFQSFARSSIFFISLGTCMFLLHRSVQLKRFVLPYIFLFAALCVAAAIFENPVLSANNTTLQENASVLALFSYIALTFLFETHLNTYNGKIFFCTDPSVVQPETILVTSFEAAKRAASKTCLKAAQVTLRCVDKLALSSKKS